LIGTQCWTKTNLKVTKYNDGTLIPDETSISPSSNWGTLQTGARTDYTGATGIPSGQTYVSTYGYLYNWYAVKGIATAGSTTYKNICPTGWHVPTDGEWTSLIQFIVPSETLGTSPGIQSSNAGGKLKSQGTAYWNSPNTGALNESGFSALPGGIRDVSGSSSSIRDVALFWSATQNINNNFTAWFRYLYSFGSEVLRQDYSKALGGSVRCLRD